MFKLARLTNEKWPCQGGAFEQVASRLGYDEFKKDNTLIGGYFVNDEGDCLICLPSGMKPWEYALE